MLESLFNRAEVLKDMLVLAKLQTEACHFTKSNPLLTCNFIRKRLQHRRFPVNFAKFLKTPILKSICERLLL